MPRMKRETWGAGDQSWLGSSHGIGDARTGNVDISAFTKATHFPNGYLPSGTDVAEVNDKLVPYDSTATDGAEVLAGFILFDQATDGVEDINVPVHDQGRIIVDHLPNSGFVKPSADNDATACVYEL